MVDNLGIEPSRRRVQGGAAHLCVARGASGEDRTRFSALRMRCTTDRAALASSAGALPAALTGMGATGTARDDGGALPDEDSNLVPGIQSAVSCRLDDPGRAAGSASERSPPPFRHPERSAGTDPASPVWKTGVSAEFTRTAWMVRRPCGVRTCNHSPDASRANVPVAGFGCQRGICGAGHAAPQPSQWS